MPFGKFECYKTKLDIVNQTFWISTDANRYIVKIDAGGVVAELTSVGNLTDKTKSYTNEKTGMSISIPTGWYVYDQNIPEEKNLDMIYLLDPEETGTNIVSVAKVKDEDTNEAKEDSKIALKTWADEAIAVKGKSLKDLKARPDSWKYRIN